MIDSTPVTNQSRKPWLAVVLSLFVPGLGQLYNGSARRALGFYLLVQLLAFLAIFVMMAPVASRFTAIVGVLIIAAGLLAPPIDAGLMARKRSSESLRRPYQRWYVYSVVIAIALLLHPFVSDVHRGLARSYRVESDAMEPTLLAGDHVAATRIRPQAVTRNTVVVFNWPGEEQKTLMRVVALSGDTIQMQSGILYVNGAAESQRELPYTEPDFSHQAMNWQTEFALQSLETDYIPTRDTWGPLVVPAERLFVLGDNRHVSLDGRYRGFVSAGDVTYKVRKIYFSRHAGKTRFSRVGELVL